METATGRQLPIATAVTAVLKVFGIAAL